MNQSSFLQNMKREIDVDIFLQRSNWQEKMNRWKTKKNMTAFLGTAQFGCSKIKNQPQTWVLLTLVV